jgi:hypothetical protein
MLTAAPRPSIHAAYDCNLVDRKNATSWLDFGWEYLDVLNFGGQTPTIRTYLLTQHRRLLALADGVAGSEELLVDERIEMDKVRGQLKKLEAEVRAAEAAG